MLLTFPLIDRLHFVIRRISQHIYLNRMNCDQSGRFRTCGYVVGSFSIQASLSPGTPQYRVTRTSYAAFTPGYMSPENMYSGRATCIQIHIIMSTDARPGYMLTVSQRHYYSFMSRSTCIPLYPATDARQTGLILSPIQDSGTVDVQQHVSWCKRGIIMP